MKLNIFFFQSRFCVRWESILKEPFWFFFFFFIYKPLFDGAKIAKFAFLHEWFLSIHAKYIRHQQSLGTDWRHQIHFDFYIEMRALNCKFSAHAVSFTMSLRYTGKPIRDIDIEILITKPLLLLLIILSNVIPKWKKKKRKNDNFFRRPS